MIKKPKVIFLFALFSSATLLAGCYTAKGVAVGVGGGLVSTVDGVAKDTTNLWGAILTADDWIKKNLW